MADQQGNHHKNGEFNPFFDYFFGIPWLFVQGSLLIRIPFDQIFDFAKYHLHKQCLWTSPSTPNSSKNHRKKHDENKENQQEKNE